jgi:hypothetical protein
MVISMSGPQPKENHGRRPGRQLSRTLARSWPLMWRGLAARCRQKVSEDPFCTFVRGCTFVLEPPAVRAVLAYRDYYEAIDNEATWRRGISLSASWQRAGWSLGGGRIAGSCTRQHCTIGPTSNGLSMSPPVMWNWRKEMYRRGMANCIEEYLYYNIIFRIDISLKVERQDKCFRLNSYKITLRALPNKAWDVDI